MFLVSFLSPTLGTDSSSSNFSSPPHLGLVHLFRTNSSLVFSFQDSCTHSNGLSETSIRATSGRFLGSSCLLEELSSASHKGAQTSNEICQCGVDSLCRCHLLPHKAHDHYPATPAFAKATPLNLVAERHLPATKFISSSTEVF